MNECNYENCEFCILNEAEELEAQSVKVEWSEEELKWMESIRF